ncbi:MAG TPA: hypothetical protein DCY72_02880 [Ruminococcaceae bacterium]|nr:hypothetical protein [Oscillospiraceae bacterium]
MSAKRKALSLILKCVVVISAAVGTYLSAVDGINIYMSSKMAFMFFTIQSNIAIAIVCAIGAVLLLRNKPIANGWFVFKFVFTISITLTGAVFTFMLAPILGEKAWSLRNVLTHVVVPLASVADFFVTGVFGDIQKKHIPYVLLPPLAYVIYATVAFIAGWEFLPGRNYPYFFLNWNSPAGAFGFSKELPFMGCVWWLILLTLLILGVGLIYVLILNRLKRNSNSIYQKQR